MRIAPQWANRRTLSEHRDLDEMFRLSHLNIPLPLIWYRAEDYEGDLADGGTLGGLRDRMSDPSDYSVGGGSGGTLQTSVLNGRPVFRFSSTIKQGRNDLNLIGDFTIALAGHVDGSTNFFIGETEINGADTEPNNRTFMVGSGGGGDWEAFHESGSGTNHSVTFGASDTNDHVMVWTRDTSATEYALKIDGGSETTGGYSSNPTGGGSAALSMPGLAAGTTFSGDIAELLLWDTLLPDSVIATVESYLNARYAIF